ESPASEVVVRDPLAEPSDLIRSVSRALRVLEAVGRAPRGLTVKQIARRCGLTVATTYHLVRTLAYEGYVIRREDGTYIVGLEVADRDRKSTRLNSSHVKISYAVFCLKKKKYIIL